MTVVGLESWHLPNVPCRGCGTPICPHCRPNLLCGQCAARYASGGEETSDIRVEGWNDSFVIDSPPRKRKRSASPLEEVITSARRKRRELPVAKHVDNVVVPPPPSTLAFLYDITEVGTPAAARWLVQMEALDASWFEAVWRNDLVPAGAARIPELFAEDEFESVWFKLGREDRVLLYRLHLLYVQRTIAQDASRKMSLIQFLITPEPQWTESLRESRWYEFILGPPAPYVDLDDTAAEDLLAGYAELALDFEADPPLASRRLSQLVPSKLDNILKALHLPQWDPAQEDAAVPPTPNGGRGGGGPAMRQMMDAVRRSATRLHEGLRGLAEDLFPWPVPELAFAGGPVRLSTRPPEVDRGPVRYHASPLPAPMAAQMPNPMLPGAHQPFVGIMNVGQGNLNVLYGNNGRIVCYFDFGFPLPFYVPTGPLYQYAPCLHDDPQIVLSSWDFDHCSFARRVRQSWHVRWIAPQQHLGAAATQQVYAQVVASAAGGSMNIWPGAPPGPPPPSHLPLPWGYIERGLALNQITDRNEGGLVMYVCVASAGVAAAAMPAAASTAVAPRAGAAPPATQGEAAAAAARIAAAAVGLQALVQAVADAADIATRTFPGFAGPAPAPADIARAALAAVGGLVGRGAGVWTHAIAAMSAIGGIAAAGGVNAAATALAGAYPPAGLVAPTAAASLGVAGVAAAIAGMAGPPPTHMEIAVALAIADAAVAAFPAGLAAAAAAAPAAAPAVALAAVTAVAVPAALNAGVALAVAPAANPAVAAAVNALQIDAQLTLVAACGAGSAAEAMVANGAAPALLPGVYARAAVAAVSRLVASDGTWQQALFGIRAAGGGAANAIIAAHAPGGPYMGAVVPAIVPASLAATVTAVAAALPGIAGGLGGVGAVLEAWTAGAAMTDAARASNVTVQAIAAVAPIVGAAAVAQAAADAGAGAAPVAHGAAPGASISEAAVATNQPVATRDAVAWGRDAARQVLLALALAPAAGPAMPPVAAPLPAPAGFALVGGVAPAPAGLPAAVAAVGAAAPGGAALVNNIQAGPGPVNAAERWVLLTGDMSFGMMPSQAAAAVAAWPVVVGLTATHHGANTCFPDETARSHIPFAPGSAAAYAAASAAAAPAGMETAAAGAGYAAAEAAIHVGEVPVTAFLPFPLITAAATAANGAATPAAALAALQGGAGGMFTINAAAAHLVGLAGATAQARIAAAAGNAAPAIVAVLAAHLLTAQLGGGMTVAIAQACAAGAAAVLPVGFGAAAMAGALPGVAGTLGNAAVTAAAGAVAAVAAAGAAAGLTASDWRRATIVVSFVAALADATGALAGGAAAVPSSASAVAARAASGAAIADAAALAGAVLPAGSLPAAVLPAADVFWPNGVGIAGLPNLLAVAPAAAVDVAVEAAVAAVAAAAATVGAAGAAAAPLERSACIAYSYGVRNTPGNLRHYYGPINERHPHPWAVWAYVGHGWTSRRNASVNAWQSAQPHPFPAPAAFVPGGPAAMGWEVAGAPAYAGPVRGDGGAGTFDRATCALCGNFHFVVC